MSTATARIPPTKKSAQPSSEQRFVLHGVPWDSYVAIGEALPDWPVRMTYDRGSLEFMTTSLEHEEYGHLLVLLVIAWAREMKLRVKGYGRTTLRRQDMARGMEPDACFYFQNLARIRGKKRILLPGDPPPDLAIEIEVSRSILDRIAILASIGTPELWRFDGDRIRLYRLEPRAKYREIKRSPTFPTLPVQELVRFVKLGAAEDDATMLDEFHAWAHRQPGKPEGHG